MHSSTTPFTQTPSPNRRWFHLDSEFRDELQLLLSRASPGCLVLLDTNGSLFGLADPQCCKLLETWLSISPLAQIRLVTFVESYLLAHAAPFQRLRVLKASQIHWGLVPQERQGQIQQALALCKEGFVKKPVRDAFHGFADDSSQEVQGLLDYFEQVWQVCEPASPVYTLGL